MLAPAGILGEPFYKIFQMFAPLRAYQGSPFTKYSKMLAPAGILREPFYKIVKIVVASVASCRVGSRRVASCRVGRRVFIFYNFYIVYNVYIRPL